MGHPSLGGQTQVSLHCRAQGSQSAVPGILAMGRVPGEVSATEAYIPPVGPCGCQSRSAKESDENLIKYLSSCSVLHLLSLRDNKAPLS